MHKQFITHRDPSLFKTPGSPPSQQPGSAPFMKFTPHLTVLQPEGGRARKDSFGKLTSSIYWHSS